MTARFLFAAALVVFGGYSATVSANEGPSARFHFDRARDAFDAGRYAQALEHFLAVQRLVSSVGTTFNIALCFKELGRPSEEFFYLSKFKRDAVGDVSRAAELAIAETRLRALQERVAQVLIETEPPGASVFIDRRELGSHGVTPLVLALKPGQRTVWLNKAGYREARVSVKARRGRRAEQKVTLEQVVGRLQVTSTPASEVLVTNQRGATVSSGPAPARRGASARRLHRGGRLPWVLESSGCGARPRRRDVGG